MLSNKSNKKMLEEIAVIFYTKNKILSCIIFRKSSARYTPMSVNNTSIGRVTTSPE